MIDYDRRTLYVAYRTMNRSALEQPTGEDDTFDVASSSLPSPWNSQRRPWTPPELSDQQRVHVPKVRIDGSYPRFNFTSVKFLARNQKQWPSLLLSKGSVYVAFGPRPKEEFIDYHGWVFRYDAATLEQTGVFNTSPNEERTAEGWPMCVTFPTIPCPRGVGIWQGGGGLVADDNGQLYLIPGQGPKGPASAAKGTFGDSS